MNPPYPQMGPNPATPPKNWLVESILVTIFCCLPLGIVGIVFASRVNTKFAAGDYEGALKASADAGKWTKIGFGIGIVVAVISIILQVMFGLSVWRGGINR